MSRDRRALGWGAALLAVGGTWLLFNLGILARVGFALVSTWALAGIAAVSYLGWRVAPDRRSALLVTSGLFAALAVIALGDILGFLPDALEGPIFFAGLAVPFARLYVRNRARTWALLSAWIFAVLGLTALADDLGRGGDRVSGLLFLWGAAVPFAWLFLRSGRDWAIVPAGGLATLGLLSLTSNLGLRVNLQLGLVCLGFAATFAALSLLGKPGKVAWARLPAVALLLLGIVAMVARPLLFYGLPLLLIASGAWLIYQAVREPAGENGPPSSPPADLPAA